MTHELAVYEHENQEAMKEEWELFDKKGFARYCKILRVSCKGCQEYFYTYNKDIKIVLIAVTVMSVPLLQNAVKDFKKEKTLYARAVAMLSLPKEQVPYIAVTLADKRLTVGVLQML